MKIQILTPEKAVFDAEAESVRVPGELGGFEVLKDHAPILSGLVPGLMRTAVPGRTGTRSPSSSRKPSPSST